VVGFGAGHFYAQDQALGVGFFALDFVGVGATVGGMAGAAQGNAIGADVAMWASLGLAASRLLQIGTAVGAARYEGERMLTACGY